jgi:hypothetical protein
MLTNQTNQQVFSYRRQITDITVDKKSMLGFLKMTCQIYKSISESVLESDTDDHESEFDDSVNQTDSTVLRTFYFGRLNNKLETTQDGNIVEWDNYDKKADVFLKTECVRDKKYYSVNFGEKVNFTIYLKDLASDYFWKNLQKKSSTVS